VGARLTFGLVIVAAIALIGGFATHTRWLIYISIACSVLAAVGLFVSSRRRRASGRIGAAEDMAWTASLAEPADTAEVAVVAVVAAPAGAFAPDAATAVAALAGRRGRRAVRDGSGPAPAPALAPAVRFDLPRGDEPGDLNERHDDRDDRDDDFEEDPGFVPAPTRRRYARAAVSAAPPEDQVAASPYADSLAGRRPPKRSPVASDWVQDAQAATIAPAPPAGAAAASARPARARPAPASPAPARVPAAAPAPRPATPVAAVAAPAVRRRRPPVEEYPFPIEDYDYLEEEDILPLLRHLDDQELVEVLLREKSGANRVAILDHLDVLLEGEDW
jgi:hypothetical protein